MPLMPKQHSKNKKGNNLRHSVNDVALRTLEPFKGVGNPLDVDTLVKCDDLNSYNWQHSLELKTFQKKMKEQKANEK